MPAILYRLGDFAHPIRTGRNLVFKLDGRLDIPFVIPQQAQDLPDRRVPLAEGCVGTIMKLPIFQMHMRNPLVMPLDERDRRNIVPGHEVSDIHVRAVIFCKGKSRLPMFGLGRGVPVITNHELVLVRKLSQPFKVFFLVCQPR